MDRALRFHTQCKVRSAINKPLLRIRWIFQCRTRDAPHSLVRGKFRNSPVSPEGSRRSLLNFAERDGERAENNRQRQRPETELDFQCGPGGTTADEPDYAWEGHACATPGFGEFIGISAAAGERRQIDSQLSDVRCHYG